MRLQVEDRAPAVWPSGAQSWRSSCISWKANVPRSWPGWMRLTLYTSRKMRAIAFRLVAAGVADRIADQVNRPAFRAAAAARRPAPAASAPAVDLRTFHFQQRQVVAVVDADHGADAVAGAGHALVAGTVVHPGRDAGTELPGVAAVLDEDFGDPPRRHQDVVADEEAGAGPVVFGVAEQLDAADAALGHLHVLALVLQNVPQRRYGPRLPPLTSTAGRPYSNSTHSSPHASSGVRSVGAAARSFPARSPRPPTLGRRPRAAARGPVRRPPGRTRPPATAVVTRAVRSRASAGPSCRTARRSAARTWAGSCQPRISWRSCRTMCKHVVEAFAEDIRGRAGR